jgi:hypothetical protein
MSFIKLLFRPGLNRDQTNYSNEGGWYACDKIRFRSGFPQKLGGWQRSTSETFLGVCRQMFGWITSFGDNFLALGTSKKVYINVGAQYYDITPLRETTAAGAVTFSAVTTAPYSTTITVNDSGANVEAGDFVTFSGASGLGGNITAAVLNQEYEVLNSISANQYTITAKDPTTGLPVTSSASDVGNGGASVVGAYQIPIGNDNTIYGYGWGAGSWGSSPWGLGESAPLVIQQRDWFFDNFDNDLVMNIRDGEIYYWVRGQQNDINVQLDTRAVLLSSLVGAENVPVQAMQILVSQNDKHLLAFGCTPFGSTSTADFDPLLIRWAAQDAPEFWTPGTVIVPSTGNLSSAGFIRVSRGSSIVRALPTRQTILVWTNSHLYSLQYTGTTEVFGLQEIADNLSVMGPRAIISANNVTYWMGTDKFYGYAGAVETLPCTLRNHVFNNINYNQKDQVIAGTSEGFHEIWWFYPSANSEQVDSYVVYNYLERLWHYGYLDRTAWLDSPLRPYPQAVGYNNLLMNHEIGVDADGAPMESYIQSSDFDLQDGDQFMLTRRIIPDINFEGSAAATPTVDFMIKPRNFPGSTYQADSFDTQGVISSSVDTYTDQIWMRARARQMALKVMSTELGVTWQLGSPRLDARPDGRR